MQDSRQVNLQGPPGGGQSLGEADAVTDPATLDRKGHRKQKRSLTKRIKDRLRLSRNKDDPPSASSSSSSSSDEEDARPGQGTKGVTTGIQGLTPAAAAAGGVTASAHKGTHDVARGEGLQPTGLGSTAGAPKGTHATSGAAAGTGQRSTAGSHAATLPSRDVALPGIQPAGSTPAIANVATARQTPKESPDIAAAGQHSAAGRHDVPKPRPNAAMPGVDQTASGAPVGTGAAAGGQHSTAGRQDVPQEKRRNVAVPGADQSSSSPAAAGVTGLAAGQHSAAGQQSGSGTPDAPKPSRDVVMPGVDQSASGTPTGAASWQPRAGGVDTSKASQHVALPGVDQTASGTRAEESGISSTPKYTPSPIEYEGEPSRIEYEGEPSIEYESGAAAPTALNPSEIQYENANTVPHEAAGTEQSSKASDSSKPDSNTLPAAADDSSKSLLGRALEFVPGLGSASTTSGPATTTGAASNTAAQPRTTTAVAGDKATAAGDSPTAAPVTENRSLVERAMELIPGLGSSTTTGTATAADGGTAAGSEPKSLVGRALEYVPGFGSGTTTTATHQTERAAASDATAAHPGTAAATPAAGEGAKHAPAADTRPAGQAAVEE